MIIYQAEETADLSLLLLQPKSLDKYSIHYGKTEIYKAYSVHR